MGVGLLGCLGAQPVASGPVGRRPAEPPLLRIGVLADAQYADADALQGRYYRISLEKVHAAVDTFNALGVDMVVNLGDLIDERLESYGPVMREIARLQMPVQHVLGNHEFWQVPFHEQITVLERLGLRSGYCELDIPGWRLLFLDGTELAEYAQGAHRELADEAELCRAGLKGQANNWIWNGAIGAAQMAWMDWQLSDADARGLSVALFCHFPITPDGDGMTLWNDADLRVLLSRHPSAKVWLAGHSHTGSHRIAQEVHHLTLEGMLMTADSNAFAILDFYPDRLVVEGYGREPFRVLPLPGTAVEMVETFPDTQAPPDAMPEPEIPCLHRRVQDALGRWVLIEDVGGLEPPNPPRLRPGCYGSMEVSAGEYRFIRRVVLPGN